MPLQPTITRGFWAEQVPQNTSWATDFTQTLDWSGAPFCLVVCRRRTQRGLQLRRPPRRGAGHATGSPFTSRASRATPGRSPMPTCSARSARPPTHWESLGVGKGDTVVIHLPMIPEAAIAMLACARIGAPHPGGLRRLLGRGPQYASMTPSARWSSPPTAATAAAPQRTQAGRRRRARSRGHDRGEGAGRQADRPTRRGNADRDLWWSDVVDAASAHARPTRRRAPAVHPLYLRDHRQAQRHLPHHRWLRRSAPTPTPWFDVHPESDVYWCTADIGWVTGHKLHRLRTVGARRHPGHVYVRGHAGHSAPGPVVGDHPKYKMTILYTAPTAVRAFMKAGPRHPR